MAEMIKKTHPLPLTLIDLFAVGMDRKAPHYFASHPGDRGSMFQPTYLNLGAGYKFIEHTQPLSMENGWDAETDGLPFADMYIDTIFALHFFEHLTREGLFRTLRECERVLRLGGLINVVVPWYGSQLAFQDLDHKTFWTVETWKNLLENQYYDGSMPRDWNLEERFSLIMGLSDRNLVVVSQLMKK